MAWNSCGFHANTHKVDVLSVFLSNFSPFNYHSPSLTYPPSPPHVVCILESHGTSDELDSQPSLPGYAPMFAAPRTNRSSGCIIYAKSNVDIQYLAPCSYNITADPTMVLTFNVSIAKSAPTCISFAYIHPNASPPSLALAQEAVRSAAESSHETFTLMGDLNARSRTWNDSAENAAGPKWAQFFFENQLTVLNAIKCPGQSTHPSSGSIIDLSVSNDPNNISRMTIDTGLLESDHLPLIISIGQDDVDALPSPTATHARWGIARANWDLYATLQESWLSAWFVAYSDVLALRQAPPDANWASSTLESSLSDLIEMTFIRPAKRAVGMCTVHPHTQNWWTATPNVQPAYLTYVAARRKYLELSTAARDDAKRSHAPVYTRYMSSRNSFRQTCADAKDRSRGELGKRLAAKPNCALYFSYLKRLKRGDTTAEMPLIRNIEGVAASSVSGSLNNLASFFSSVFSTPSVDGHCQRTAAEVQSFMESKANDVSECKGLETSITIEEVKAALKAVGRSNAADGDSLIPLFIVHSTPDMDRALQAVFNFSLYFGVVPATWRTAKGIPLYKGRGKDKKEAASYRLIAITSLLVRAMEHIIYTRISALLERKNMLSRTQFGFRRRRSAYDAVTILLHRIYASYSSGSFLPATFLDIAGAYDHIWHEGLLFKLAKAGIQGRIWRWIRSFLSGRAIRVVQAGQSSESFPVAGGVPQGSVLAPLLFILYIADLPDTVIKSITLLFADDICLFPRQCASIDQAVADINADFAKLTEWTYKWRLHFSPQKCASVLFTRSSEFTADALNGRLRLEGGQIAVVPNFRYLGIVLDAELRWRAQADVVKGAITRSSFAISNLISQNAPPSANDVRHLVRSLIFARMAYCLPFWTPTEADTKAWVSAMCHPLRTVLGLPKYVSMTSVLREFVLPTPDHYQQYLALRLAARYQYRASPDNPARSLFQALIQGTVIGESVQDFNSETHKHNVAAAIVQLAPELLADPPPMPDHKQHPPQGLHRDGLPRSAPRPVQPRQPQVDDDEDEDEEFNQFMGIPSRPRPHGAPRFDMHTRLASLKNLPPAPASSLGSSITQHRSEALSVLSVLLERKSKAQKEEGKFASAILDEYARQTKLFEQLDQDGWSQLLGLKGPRISSLPVLRLINKALSAHDMTLEGLQKLDSSLPASWSFQSHQDRAMAAARAHPLGLQDPISVVHPAFKKKVPQYLKDEPRRTQILRGRLRFDCSDLMWARWRRRLVPNPFCPLCSQDELDGNQATERFDPDQVHDLRPWSHILETREHCLLSCPAYAGPRWDLLTELTRIRQMWSGKSPIPRFDLDLSLVLNPSHPCLFGPTATFLNAVKRMRDESLDKLKIRHFPM